jgi:hypothetical protein
MTDVLLYWRAGIKFHMSHGSGIRRRDVRCDTSGVSLVVATYHSFGSEPPTLTLPREGGGSRLLALTGVENRVRPVLFGLWLRVKALEI